MQEDAAAALADGSEVYRVIDTTLIPTMVRVRACRTGLSAARAAFGRSVSKTEWVCGFKVRLAVSPAGEVTAFGLARGSSSTGRE